MSVLAAQQLKITNAFQTKSFNFYTVEQENA